MRHVLVGVPFIGHWVTFGIAQFAEACGYQNALARDVRFTVRYLSGSSVISFNVEFMRNSIVGMVKRDPSVTDLMFIDSDTMPPPNAMDLLHVNSDIAAGVYKIPDGRDGWTWSVYEGVSGKFKRITELPDKPFEAGGAGTGAMIIKRRVLDDPGMSLGEGTEGGPPCIFRTPRDLSGACLGTDDLDFCRRARALGYRLIVDPRVKFGHVKTRLYA